MGAGRPDGGAPLSHSVAALLGPSVSRETCALPPPSPWATKDMPSPGTPQPSAPHAPKRRSRPPRHRCDVTAATTRLPRRRSRSRSRSRSRRHRTHPLRAVGAHPRCGSCPSGAVNAGFADATPHRTVGTDVTRPAVSASFHGSAPQSPRQRRTRPNRVVGTVSTTPSPRHRMAGRSPPLRAVGAHPRCGSCPSGAVNAGFADATPHRTVGAGVTRSAVSASLHGYAPPHRSCQSRTRPNRAVGTVSTAPHRRALTPAPRHHHRTTTAAARVAPAPTAPSSVAPPWHRLHDAAPRPGVHSRFAPSTRTRRRHARRPVGAALMAPQALALGGQRRACRTVGAAVSNRAGGTATTTPPSRPGCSPRVAPSTPGPPTPRPLHRTVGAVVTRAALSGASSPAPSVRTHGAAVTRAGRSPSGPLCLGHRTAPLALWSPALRFRRRCPSRRAVDVGPADAASPYRSCRVASAALGVPGVIALRCGGRSTVPQDRTAVVGIAAVGINACALSATHPLKAPPPPPSFHVKHGSVGGLACVSPWLRYSVDRGGGEFADVV
ncbi:hypothetical protein SAMN05444920_104597 [Nonomuraea solani]|uniref:Uncharacterized protein n=1 Tax=Nonomuraea solani TaxID=1144553 RepID=A0A1H6D011_9ACTN|nr:hypothetical protein SAMN05444920_104597 [Nonomuraea solani]